MKALTWKEIIIAEKGLKEYREENNIFVPDEYVVSTRRLAAYACFLSFISGISFVLLFNLLGEL